MLEIRNQLDSPFKGRFFSNAAYEFSSEFSSAETPSFDEGYSLDVVDDILFTANSSNLTADEYADIMLLNLERNENNTKNEAHIIKFNRPILIDWMIWVCYDFQLSDETLFTSISIFDKYLSLEKEEKNINLAAACSLWISSKLNEVRMPSVANMVMICKNQFNEHEFLSFEAKMLNTLKFNIAYPTSIHFTDSLLSQIPIDEIFENYVSFFCHCSLYVEELIAAKASHISLAAIILAKIATDNKMNFNVVIRSLSIINENDLISCLLLITKGARQVFQRNEFSIAIKFEPFFMMTLDQIEDVEKKIQNLTSERFDIFLDSI